MDSFSWKTMARMAAISSMASSRLMISFSQRAMTLRQAKTTSSMMYMNTAPVFFSSGSESLKLLSFTLFSQFCQRFWV